MAFLDMKTPSAVSNQALEPEQDGAGKITAETSVFASENGSDGDYGFPAEWTKPMEDDTSIRAPQAADEPAQMDSAEAPAASSSVNTSEEFTPQSLRRKIIMETKHSSVSNLREVREYAPREDSPLYTTEKMLYDAQRSIKLSEELSESGKIESQIADSVRFVGDLYFNGTGASIAGEVEGSVTLDGGGVLYLMPSSVIKGNIKARNIIAEGKINGNIKCERLIATSTAILMGDVEYRDVFNPAPGAKVEGKLCSNPNVFTDSPEKNTLSAAANS
tara:strand:+ start:522 stop:1346 length:825 start_codon:yes stop_codon:yes gene_type:complete